MRLNPFYDAIVRAIEGRRKVDGYKSACCRSTDLTAQGTDAAASQTDMERRC